MYKNITTKYSDREIYDRFKKVTSDVNRQDFPSIVANVVLYRFNIFFPVQIAINYMPPP